MRASQFAELAPAPGHVVLLGDSITEQGLWQEWFSGQPVLNRGISGETSADLLAAFVPSLACRNVCESRISR